MKSKLGLREWLLIILTVPVAVLYAALGVYQCFIYPMNH